MGVLQPHQVEHALHRAVLARRAVERVEHDIGLRLGQPRATSRSMSIRVTWWPSASARRQRPCRDISETSRSADQPPIRTATWSGLGSLRPLPTRWISHSSRRRDLCLHPRAHFFAQAPRYRRWSQSPRLSRKLVCFSLTCASPIAQAAAAGRIDQLPRPCGPAGFLKVEPPVFERSGCDRLARGGDAVHLGLDRGGLARHARERSPRRRSRPRAASLWR